jgi:hypothetical protein
LNASIIPGKAAVAGRKQGCRYGIVHPATSIPKSTVTRRAFSRAEFRFGREPLTVRIKLRSLYALVPISTRLRTLMGSVPIRAAMQQHGLILRVVVRNMRPQ